MTDDEKTFLLTVMLGCAASVREDEKPGTRRHRRMMDLEDRIVSVTNEYSAAAWPPEKCAIAAELIDKVNEYMKEAFT